MQTGRGEEAFKESEEKLKVIVEACLDAIIALDERSNIVLFNPAAEELFLYSSEEVLNKPVKILLRKDVAETHQKRLEGAVFKHRMGQCGHIGRRLERTFRRKDGTIFNAEVAMAGGLSNGKRIIVVSIHDITERKKVEEALRESETHFRLWAEKAHRSKDAFLDMLENVSEAYKELDELFMGFVKSIVNAIDARSIWTKGHSERVAAYAEKIAKEMGIDEEDIKNLRLAALLHDIGKIGTYDYLVDKPARLTNEEFDIVKKHPVQGATILEGVKQF